MPLDPPVANEAPTSDVLTGYDQEHLITYLPDGAPHPSRAHPGRGPTLARPMQPEPFHTAPHRAQAATAFFGGSCCFNASSRLGPPRRSVG